MSAIITITNQKGGVGKTTTSSALMDGLHSRGARVLGVDLDPQGSLGFCLGLDIENCATVYDVLKGAANIREVIMESDCGDILPSNILLSAAELEFNRPGREFLLKNCLAEVADEYDYIIIDTPPALNVLTVNAYVAADTVRRCYNSRLRVLGIVLNKFNQRFTLNREVLDMAEQIAKQLDTQVFQSRIRSGVAVAEAPAHGESVLSYAPDSKVARDFRLLINEIIRMYDPTFSFSNS